MRLQQIFPAGLLAVASMCSSFAFGAPTYTYRLPSLGVGAGGAGGAGAAVDPTWSRVNMAGIGVGEAMIVLATDGGVWTKGYNSSGELGNGTTTDTPTWTKVATDGAQVYEDRFKGMLIKTDGSLWFAGWNGNGDFGLGDTANRSVFTQVPGMSNIAKITHGESATHIIKTNGTLWSSGNNYYSQRGVPGAGSANSKVFVQTTLPFPAGVTPVDIVQVGSYVSMILDSEGNVWGAGYDFDGALGMGPVQTYSTYTKIPYFNKNATALAATKDSSAVLTNDGVVHTAGRNSGGQLGRGTDRWAQYPAFAPAVSGVSRLLAGMNTVMVVKTDGTIWSTNATTEDQNNYYGQPPGFIKWSISADVKSFGANPTYIWLVKNDGSMWMPEAYFTSGGTFTLKQYKFLLQ